MSVNWNATKCPAQVEANEFPKDSDQLKDYVNMRDSLIWALLVTGFPPKSPWVITEANWRTLYKRIAILERVVGVYRLKWNEQTGWKKCEIYFTPADIQSMIGLSVNAGNRTDAEFRKYIMQKLFEQVSEKVVEHDMRECPQ